MAVLVVVRDFILTVLLSWIGVQAPEPAQVEPVKSPTAEFRLSSGKNCETSPILMLEAREQELPADKVTWQHS